MILRRRTRNKPPLWLPLRLQWLTLSGMLVFCCAPHLWRMHILAILGWLLLVAWRLLLGLRQRQPPGRLLRLLMVVLAGLSLYLQFGTLIGKDAGSALLVMMAALKFLELRSSRDAVVLIYLCYFLIVVQLLFSQSMLTALYVLAAGLLTTITLMELSDTRADRPTALAEKARLLRSFRLSTTLLLQATPVMLILFLLFPRIPGPLWSLPHDAHSGMTGLSDEMEPGRISQLVRSEAIAFRVEFENEMPPPEQRYWRGPVFERTDGRRWFPAYRPYGESRTQDVRPRPLDKGIRHTITLEAHGKRNLPALDLPLQVPANAYLQADLQVLAKSPVLERIRYPITSYQHLQIPHDQDSLLRSLELPPDTGQRLRTLARSWQAQSSQPSDIIDLALQHFRQQPFIYTLNPPLLGKQPMEEFLFETRRGFCEHYSAAFTLLMRAAGLPARVVTGYLGGEINRVGNYLIVRQSDAHAWSEVWLADQGWVRVDPTSAVAPERVEHSIDFRPAPQGEAIQFRIPGSEHTLGLITGMRLYMDAMNNHWNQWVLGYGPSLQQQFLRDIGMPDVSLRGMTRVLTVFLVLIMIVLAIFILYPRRKKYDPATRLYLRFCHKLSRLGFTRAANEGPMDFAARANQGLPQHAETIQRIVRNYIAIRYQEYGEKNRLDEFKNQVRKFLS